MSKKGEVERALLAVVDSVSDWLQEAAAQACHLKQPFSSAGSALELTITAPNPQAPPQGSTTISIGVFLAAGSTLTAQYWYDGVAGVSTVSLTAGSSSPTINLPTTAGDYSLMMRVFATINGQPHAATDQIQVQIS